MNVPFLDIKRQYVQIKNNIEKKVCEVLESSMYVGGKYVLDFEKEISDYLDCKHAIGCANGTDALVLALRACDVRPGDEVITTPFTFFATAEAIVSIGAIPVFVDIREDDYNIDPDLIEYAITDKTKAILPVHIFGAACDMDRIVEIAHAHHLMVIEDTAQGIGATYKGKKLGTIGDIGCFSFYPTKNLGCCGDGGMAVTNNDELAVILRSLREHGAGENGAKAASLLGMDSDTVIIKEKETELYNPYKYYNYLIAYNSRLDAVQAAILSVKLKHLDDYNTKRAMIASRYNNELTPEVIRPNYTEGVCSCWHQYVIRTEYKQALCQSLSEQGIGNGNFYPIALHRQKAFSEVNSKTPHQGLPVAEKISAQTVCLPIFPELREEEIDHVINAINSFYEAQK